MPWILDSLCTAFVNGLPVGDVPRKYHRLYTLMGYLQRTLRARLGSVPASRFYGMPMFGDTFAKVPEKAKEEEKLIKDVILRNEPNTKSVRVGHWTLHKKAYLQCVIILRNRNGEKFKFRLNLIGSGAHTVEVWSSAFK